jgi:hypothetical protein
MVIWRGHTGWIMDRDGHAHVGVINVYQEGYIPKVHLGTNAEMDIYPQVVGPASSTDTTMILLNGTERGEGDAQP